MLSYLQLGFGFNWRLGGRLTRSVIEHPTSPSRTQLSCRFTVYALGACLHVRLHGFIIILAIVVVDFVDRQHDRLPSGLARGGKPNRALQTHKEAIIVKLRLIIHL